MPSAAPVSPADIAGVSVVVGEEDLLVERAVARLVDAARPADDVRHVQAAGLRPGPRNPIPILRRDEAPIHQDDAAIRRTQRRQHPVPRAKFSNRLHQRL